MREIKFRAWDDEHKKMLYGDQMHIRLHSHDGDEWFLISDGEDKHGDYIEHVLMQFTGLRDKNRREIYEGDVIISKTEFNCGISKYIGRVFYDLTSCLYRIEGQAENNTDGYIRKFAICDLWDLEIIGNIHENPELLEAGK